MDRAFSRTLNSKSRRGRCERPDALPFRHVSTAARGAPSLRPRNTPISHHWHGRSWECSALFLLCAGASRFALRVPGPNSIRQATANEDVSAGCRVGFTHDRGPRCPAAPKIATLLEDRSFSGWHSARNRKQPHRCKPQTAICKPRTDETDTMPSIKRQTPPRLAGQGRVPHDRSHGLMREWVDYRAGSTVGLYPAWPHAPCLV